MFSRALLADDDTPLTLVMMIDHTYESSIDKHRKCKWNAMFSPLTSSYLRVVTVNINININTEVLRVGKY